MSRLTYAVHFQNPGQTVIKSTIGFMSTSLDSLKMIQMALLSAKPWISDAEVVPMPWQPEYETIERTLCFGFLSCDDYVLPHPPILRALRQVEKALKRRGHNVGAHTCLNGFFLHCKLIFDVHPSLHILFTQSRSGQIADQRN